MQHEAQQIKRAFKILDDRSAKNTSLAPLASQIMITEPNKAEFYNSLEVYNRSGAAIEVQLDGATSGSKLKQVFSAALMVIEPDEGFRWTTITVKNLDAATTAAADEITIISKTTQQVENISVR